MTHVQIFTGGQLIDPDAIKAAGVRVLFSSDIEGWHEPPPAPPTPSTMRAADMPPSVRKMLAEFMAKALEQATGFKVDVRT